MNQVNSGIQAYQSVTLDSNGYGYVRWVPVLSTWTVKTVTVAGASTIVPVAKFYVGQIGRSWFKDGTSTGNSDMSDTMYEVIDGTSFWVEWSGGTAGAVMTATIMYDATVYSSSGFRTY